MSATDLINALESAAAGGDAEAARMLPVIAEWLGVGGECGKSRK